jgi:uncharacterized protein
MIEWDEAKRRINLRKHGVDFAVAVDFDWGRAVVGVDDRFDYGETRLVAIGWIAGIAHTTVFSRRGQNIRIISLRRASRPERRML